MIRRPPRSTLFPTRRSSDLLAAQHAPLRRGLLGLPVRVVVARLVGQGRLGGAAAAGAAVAVDGLVHRDTRSEEHTSELQSLRHLVCRLLLEKKKRPRVWVSY